MTGWAFVKLDDLTTVVTKGTTPTSMGYEFKDAGINFVKVESISNNGTFIPDKFAKIDDECNAQLQRSQLEENDILFSIAGAIGRTAIVPKSILPANTNQALAIIRLKPDAPIYPDYLLRALASQSIIEQTDLMKGGVAQQNLSLAQLKAFEIPLPPLPVQKAIVAKLDAAFASIEQAIAAAERNAENADKLYKNEVDSVFNNFAYELQKLGNNAEISYGYTAKSSSQYDGPHYLRITDIQNNDVNWTDVPRCVIGEKEFKKFKLETGDIVFARTGATTGKSFLLAAPPPAVFASYLIKVAVNKSVFRPEFIYQYFSSASYWTFVRSGISGAAQGGFNASKLSSLPIPLPPLDEQDNAVQRLLDFESQTKHLAEIYIRKAKAMSELKQSLLNQAFNGQLVDA